MIGCESVCRPGTIMNRAFQIGIMLAVAIHMVGGCCLHHAHAHGGLSDTKGFAARASCPCHHRGSVETDGCCDHPSQPQQCDGHKCVFTRPDPSDAPDLSIGHGCLNPVCVSPGLPTLRGIDRGDSRLGEPGQPIPLHLLNQVLLI